MNITMEKIFELRKKAVEDLRNNPGNGYWLDVYEHAPEDAKWFYERDFAGTFIAMAGADNKALEEITRIEEEDTDEHFRMMSDEAYDYIIKYECGPGKCGIHDVRIHMQGKPGVKMGDWYDETYE